MIAKADDIRMLEARAMRRLRVRFWKWVAMHLPCGAWGFRKFDSVLDEAIGIEFGEMVLEKYEMLRGEPEEM